MPVWVEIKAGDTVLLNGKDVTGNLGSKIAHGDHSPIIEDIQNSQITTGSIWNLTVGPYDYIMVS